MRSPASPTTMGAEGEEARWMERAVDRGGNNGAR